MDALDSFADYGAAFDPWRPLLESAGVRRLDFDGTGFDLGRLSDAAYDAVLLMGVIEHLPHSPRPLLTAARRVLAPGGVLVLDTPNIAYGYNREKLLRGESIMAPIASQFDCVTRRGTSPRVHAGGRSAGCSRVGFELVALDAFKYSQYGLTTIAGDDLRMHREAISDPTRREVIFAAASRPRD